MLKPLQIDYRGHSITLECTYKKVWPPPQMYGHTPEDVDVMWKQGAIDGALHQRLTTWKEKCGLMVMGPRCLDCPLAKIQNPRPGRPEVFETEPWLARKERMYWDDMEAGKGQPSEGAEENEAPTRHAPLSKKAVADKMIDKGILESEPDNPPSTVPDKKPQAVAEEPEDEDIGAELAAATAELKDEVAVPKDLADDDDVIDALAED